MTNAPNEVVVFCPLPPKPNGIADYFAEQLPYFSRKTKVTVVIEDTHPEPKGIAASVNILRLEEYMWHQRDYSTVPHIYHVGNNPDTKYMLPVLLSKPGLVVVHDLNLHYLIDLTNLSLGDKKGYQQALTNNYGDAGKIIGKQLAEYGWKGQFMPHELMMNSSIIIAAERILVHSKYSADKIGALGHPNVCLVPHHFSPAARRYQSKLKMQYRGELGLPGNKAIITSMGFIAKAKQIKSVLKALSSLKKQGVDFTYVLAGKCKPHEYDVYQDIADSGLSENVVVTGFLDEDAFFKYMLASDFIVNLRYPTGGESSGTLTRAMGMGLCCVVVNIGPFSELPKDCAVKLEWDNDFDENLSIQLKQLIENKQYRVTIGKNAQKWIEATHNISATTNAYLEEASKLVDTTTFKSKALNSDVHSYLPSEAIIEWDRASRVNENFNNLWWRANLVPINQECVVSIAINQEFQVHVLQNLFGYTTDQIEELSLEQIELCIKEKVRSLAVVEASLNDIALSPMNLLRRLNTIIALGGKLILTLEVPHSLTSEYNLSRSSVKEMLVAAGFSVDKTIAGPQDINMFNNATPDVERWVFSAVKRSWMVNINPAVYDNGASELRWLLTKNERECDA